MNHRCVAIDSLPQACQVIKEMNLEMNLDHDESDYRSARRHSLEAISEGRMQEPITFYLEEMAWLGQADRRNGSFSRHLLTELGDIELTILRTRRFSPVSIIRAYARRAHQVDRLILACLAVPDCSRRCPCSIPASRCNAAGPIRAVMSSSTEKGYHEAVKATLHEIQYAMEISKAQTALGVFRARWNQIYTKAVACLCADEKELMSFFRFKDSTWWSQIRTTNAIERRFREVRRRTRPRNVFSDRTGMEWILCAVFSYENHRQGVATFSSAVTQNC